MVSGEGVIGGAPSSAESISLARFRFGVFGAGSLPAVFWVVESMVVDDVGGEVDFDVEIAPANLTVRETFELARVQDIVHETHSPKPEARRAAPAHRSFVVLGAFAANCRPTLCLFFGNKFPSALDPVDCGLEEAKDVSRVDAITHWRCYAGFRWVDSASSAESWDTLAQHL